MDQRRGGLAAIPTGASPEQSETWRSPPRNVEAEQALLGAILVNNEAISRVVGFLRAEHFFEPIHQRIYEAASRMIDRQQLANPITLKAFFERDQGLAEIGGPAYLARLATAATTIINAEDYARQIYDLALRRSLIQVGETLVNQAYDPDIESSANDQIEHAEQALFELAEKGENEGGFQSFYRSLTTAVQQAEAAFKRDGKLTGVNTGLDDLNRMLGGLHPSDLIILAGRPGMGKTALAANIGFNAANARRKALANGVEPELALDGAVVGFFSLEMSSEQLATRMLADHSGITTERIRRGQLGREDFVRLVESASEIEQTPFFIDATPGISMPTLRNRARRLKRTQGLGLIVVDYLQLIEGKGRGDNRVQEISEISRGLKILAKELNVPVLALSQLSRKPEERDDKRPQLADLRESGSIEQDADLVLFVYRDEYYLQRKEPPAGTAEHAAWQAEMDKVHNIAEVLVAKNRHGPTGKVELSFEGEFTRFGNLAHRDRFPDPEY
ncbi:replicative DNA helicase [Zavarzinia sp. CC-PAN008]|uniref:replicative DNA helicase n=1 Tax=Zavarzinia sp. CC-PAN008 TaxID=3243332 RepID=UPI003F744CE6